MIVALVATLALARAAAAQQPRGRITVLTPTGGPADHVAEGADWFTLALGAPRQMNEAAEIRWAEHKLSQPADDSAAGPGPGYRGTKTGLRFAPWRASPPTTSR